MREVGDRRTIVLENGQRVKPLPLWSFDTEAEARRLIRAAGRRQYDGTIIWSIPLPSSGDMAGDEFTGTLTALEDAEEWVRVRYLGLPPSPDHPRRLEGMRRWQEYDRRTTTTRPT